MDLLEYACVHHTDGLTDADPTVQACWDADRRDLPRVGVTVKPHRLCTTAAKAAETIEWTEQRARQGCCYRSGGHGGPPLPNVCRLQYATY